MENEKLRFTLMQEEVALNAMTMKILDLKRLVESLESRKSFRAQRNEKML